MPCHVLYSCHVLSSLDIWTSFCSEHLQRHNLVTYTVSKDFTAPGRRAFFCLKLNGFERGISIGRFWWSKRQMMPTRLTQVWRKRKRKPWLSGFFAARLWNFYERMLILFLALTLLGVVAWKEIAADYSRIESEVLSWWSDWKGLILICI